MHMVRAIFLNRYSIINEYRGACFTGLDRSCFLPTALTALRWLHLAGFQVFVISHQPQVSRGEVAPSAIEELHNRLRWWAELSGGRISAVRYYPYEHGENRLSPQIEMVQDLADEWNLDLSRAYLVGDTLNDMLAAQATGCRRLMVRTGYGAEQAALPGVEQCRPDHLAKDLLGAVRWVLRQENLTLPQTANDTLLRSPRLPSRTPLVGV